MPRPKTLSDRDVLAAAHKLIHERGPEALTFESLARACGLSAFDPGAACRGPRPGLKQSTLLHAWDRLDEKTASLAATVPKTAAGAIELLVALSRDYGGHRSLCRGPAGAARRSARPRPARPRRRLEGLPCRKRAR